MSQVLNVGSDDPNDPVAIVRERWKTERHNIPFCCEELKQQITKGCDLHGYECPDYFVQIGIPFSWKTPMAYWCGQAGNASYKISHCPFCGTKLPKLKNVLDK